MSGLRSILVIQLARFGDFLQTTPLLARLKRAYPRAALTAAVDRGQAQLAANNPDVDEALTVDVNALAEIANRPGLGLYDRLDALARHLGGLAGRRFDRVINLNTSGPAALIALLPRSADRQGPALAADRRQLTPPFWAGFIMRLMARRRLIRFNLVDLLSGYAPDGPAPKGLTWPLTDADRRQGMDRIGGPNGLAVGFQVGSRHQSRQWPPENFAELARRLIREDDAKIVLLGVEAERPLGEAVQAELARLDPEAASSVIDLMGRTSLSELAGVLAALDLLVTTDTGTMHLAAAVKTRILALFQGPAFCHETGPYGDGDVILQAMTDCSPCTENEASCDGFPCRRLIRPPLAAAAARMAASGGPTPADEALDRGEVQLLTSRLDRFGLGFHPLIPPGLDADGLAALAAREAGRRLIRSSHRFMPEELAGDAAAWGVLLEDAFNAARALTALSHPPLVKALIKGDRSAWSRVKALGDKRPEIDPLARILLHLIHQGRAPAAAAFAADLGRAARIMTEDAGDRAAVRM